MYRENVYGQKRLCASLNHTLQCVASSFHSQSLRHEKESSPEDQLTQCPVHSY